MSRKRRKIKEKAVSLQTRETGEKSPVSLSGPMFCGFPLNKKRVNQLWNWVTLEDVKF